MAGTVPAGTKLSGALLGIPPWIPMATVASWVNIGGGNVIAQYRKWAQINEVEVIGSIQNGTTTTGTVIFTMPAGYIPASNQSNSIQGNETGGALSTVGTPSMSVSTSGSVQIFNVPSGTTQLNFHFWYSLDA